MHPNFVESFKALDQKYRTNTEEFSPYYMLLFAWTAFWELRSTKAYESPVNYTDIKAYMDVMNITLCPSEVKAILFFDRSYYKYYQKYKL